MPSKKSPVKNSDDITPNGWPDDWKVMEVTSDEVNDIFTELKRILPKCMRSPRVDHDRRLSKMPEYQLISIFKNLGDKYSASTKPLIADVAATIANTMVPFTQALLDLDMKYEGLLEHLEVKDYDALLKKRKELMDCCSEWKSGKKDEGQVLSLRQETLNMLFEFDADCYDHVTSMISIIRHQLFYYEHCKDLLNVMFLDIEKKFRESMPEQPFTTPMVKHMKDTNRSTPYVMEVCFDALRKKNAWSQEGIFRREGLKANVDTLILELNAGGQHLLNDSQPEDVASTLKRYLRENPDSIFPNELKDDWLNAMKSSTDANRFEFFNAVMQRMPQENKNALNALISALNEVLQHSSQNQMTASNLGIVFAPSVFPMGEPQAELANNPTKVQLMEFMLTNASRFFPAGACA